jgi:peroxiredoxin Q/BCP
MARELEPGDPAPEIVLPDQDGNTLTLSGLRGKWVLVYFYPRDDTPGCTVEACGLRDSAAGYAKHGVEVLGISADTPKSHRKFADKFRLPFRLLADEEKKVIRAYGSWGRKKFMGREFEGILRRSFLVDPEGRIARVYPKVTPEVHAEEVLADVEALKGAAPAPQVKATKKAVAPKKPVAAKKAAKKAPTAARPAPRAARSSKPKR